MQFRFLNAHPGRSQENLTLILWVVFFCYSICAALIFQKVVLPLMPSMHAGGGLMNEDAVYFDSVARLLAEQIRLHGWGSWQIYPANGARGNVAGLVALYALFGNHPTLIVPVNAAVVVRGMRYALVQLPFFVCGALLLKFAVATKHVVTVVAFAVVALDYWIPAAGTRKFGGSRAGMIGTTVGLLVAIIFPVLGFAGIVIWPFIGAIIGELINKTGHKQALKASFGSFVGFLTGTFLKFLVSMVYLGIFLLRAWDYRAELFPFLS